MIGGLSNAAAMMQMQNAQWQNAMTLAGANPAAAADLGGAGLNALASEITLGLPLEQLPPGFAGSGGDSFMPQQGYPPLMPLFGYVGPYAPPSADPSSADPSPADPSPADPSVASSEMHATPASPASQASQAPPMSWQQTDSQTVTSKFSNGWTMTQAVDEDNDPHITFSSPDGRHTREICYSHGRPIEMIDGKVPEHYDTDWSEQNNGTVSLPGGVNVAISANAGDGEGFRTTIDDNGHVVQMKSTPRAFDGSGGTQVVGEGGDDLFAQATGDWGSTYRTETLSQGDDGSLSVAKTVHKDDGTSSQYTVSSAP
ncbi:MAG: hypothetical protein EB084_07340 [Proteobacteria bacterium]|nr:hypothetical protein [Pseudomonadota bacterium]